LELYFRPQNGGHLLLLCEADVHNTGVDIRFFYKKRHPRCGVLCKADRNVDVRRDEVQPQRGYPLLRSADVRFAVSRQKTKQSNSFNIFSATPLFSFAHFDLMKNR
jgi:hypothetical protein